jgi:hypothetical protein
MSGAAGWRSSFELIVNMRTINALGLMIPTGKPVRGMDETRPAVESGPSGPSDPGISQIGGVDLPAFVDVTRERHPGFSVPLVRTVGVLDATHERRRRSSRPVVSTTVVVGATPECHADG